MVLVETSMTILSVVFVRKLGLKVCAIIMSIDGNFELDFLYNYTYDLIEQLFLNLVPELVLEPQNSLFFRISTKIAM